MWGEPDEHPRISAESPKDYTREQEQAGNKYLLTKSEISLESSQGFDWIRMTFPYINCAPEQIKLSLEDNTT